MSRPFTFIPFRETDRGYLVAVILLSILLGLLLGTLYVVHTVARVEGTSMYPALLDEDRVLLSRGYDHPARGDIVSLADPTPDATTGMLKRVIAVPGDEVRVIGDVAYVNGSVSGVAPDAVIGPDTTPFGTLTVPEGCVYVLGDNRPLSLDSRYIGPVPLANVQGRVIAIILPLDRFSVID